MMIKWDILSKYRNEIYGLTALWIIIFHLTRMKYCNFAKPYRFIEGYFAHGNCGVEVFLFMSGISLYYAMKKNFNIKEFYIKRIKKLLIPVIIVDGIYWMYFLVYKDLTVIGYLKNITFYSFWFESNTMVWFVACLFVLYLIYPYIYIYIY